MKLSSIEGVSFAPEFEKRIIEDNRQRLREIKERKTGKPQSDLDRVLAEVKRK